MEEHSSRNRRNLLLGALVVWWMRCFPCGITWGQCSQHCLCAARCWLPGGYVNKVFCVSLPSGGIVAYPLFLFSLLPVCCPFPKALCSMWDVWEAHARTDLETWPVLLHMGRCSICTWLLFFSMLWRSLVPFSLFNIVFLKTGCFSLFQGESPQEEIINIHGCMYLYLCMCTSHWRYRYRSDFMSYILRSVF